MYHRLFDLLEYIRFPDWVSDVGEPGSRYPPKRDSPKTEYFTNDKNSSMIMNG